MGLIQIEFAQVDALVVAARRNNGLAGMKHDLVDATLVTRQLEENFSTRQIYITLINVTIQAKRNPAYVDATLHT